MSVPYQGQSADTGVPGVSGTNTAENGVGVHGQSTISSETGKGGIGVRGDSNAVGVWGEGKDWHGVVGASHSTIGGAGVFGSCNSGVGVFGESKLSHAVQGKSESTTGGAGVWGEHTGSGAGTVGISQSGVGVLGHGATGGSFEGTFEGVHAVSHDPRAAGVAGYNDSTGPGIYGKSTGGAAGYFDGNVTVTGDAVLTGADCAEEFDVTATAEVEPGTVVVLDQYGALGPSQQAYDKRVAGVISGAGNYKPGIVLDKQQSQDNRVPVALVGKVYCKVDAQYASIQVGDLLTTSLTPGHAMKASDPLSAFGAVIGKALRPLCEGQGLIPILIALQ